MRKLFFIVIMTLYSTLTFASAVIPWPSNNSEPYIVVINKPSNPLPVVNKSTSPTNPITMTSSSSIRSLNNVISDPHVNLVMQQIAVSFLSNIVEQQNKSHKQSQPASPRRIYNESHLQPSAAAIESWNKCKQVSTKTTVQVQNVAVTEVAQAKALTVAQQETRVDTCVQVLAALVACADEDETFWKLRDIYIDSGCEERVDNRPELPENACYSVPFGATEACYLAGFGAGGAVVAEGTIGMVCTAFSGSAIGSAVLAAAPPIIMCAIVYTGSKFVVNLIRNYKQSNNEAAGLRVIRQREEKYAYDFQYALDQTLHIGTANAIPTHPLYYSMCYGFGNDLHAKVITIVDKQHKQHVFVVPDGSSKGAFQISDGSRLSESLIDPRYLVPQSMIDAIEKQQQAEKQKTQNLKDKARQDQIKAALNGVEKNLDASMKDIAKNKIPSNEHLLPENFKPAYSKDGRILRDKTGAYFDVDGKKWSPDQKNQRWNVTDLTVKGSGTNCIKFRDLNPPPFTPTVDTPSNPIDTSSIDPVVPDAPSDNSKMDMPPIEKPNNEGCGGKIEELEPKNEGCGHVDPELNKPKILTHPMPEQEDRTIVCGQPIPEDEKIDITSLPGGCGGKIDLKPEDFILKADYSNGAIKTWIDSNGNIWAEGDLSGQDVKFRDGTNKNHVFYDRKGHIVDTPENRKRIKELVLDPTKYLGSNEWGNWWYGEILPDGTQLWAEVRGDQIRNCGLNDVPREYNPGTGLSLPEAPGNNNTKQ